MLIQIQNNKKICYNISISFDLKSIMHESFSATIIFVRNLLPSTYILIIN